MRVLITTYCLLITCLCMADSITGKVVKIYDGNTFRVLVQEKNTLSSMKIKLWGIDAPEKGQPYYSQAKQALQNQIYKKTVTIEYDGEDVWGYIIGKTYINKTDISLQMIKNGSAWHNKLYSSKKEYIEAEKQARKQKQGLWAVESPIPPWIWRKKQKNTDQEISSTPTASKYSLDEEWETNVYKNLSDLANKWEANVYNFASDTL